MPASDVDKSAFALEAMAGRLSTMPSYEHTQFGWTMLVLIVIADAISVMAMVLAGAWWVGLLVIAMTLVLWLIFGRLTARVDGDRLQMRFGWLSFIRRSWPMHEIVRVERVRNPWYIGWGIRLLPGRMVFNVSGWDAVEFELRNGKVYRIGTDEPAALEAAIRDRLPALAHRRLESG